MIFIILFNNKYYQGYGSKSHRVYLLIYSLIEVIAQIYHILELFYFSYIRQFITIVFADLGE